jgi:hypothetical protein
MIFNAAPWELLSGSREDTASAFSGTGKKNIKQMNCKCKDNLLLPLSKSVMQISTPNYIKSLKLKNIKTFEDVELSFEKPDGTLPRWTIILGDNGYGKSTLLHSVAWMRPYLPYKREDTPENFKAGPSIDDEPNDLLIHLVRKYINSYEDESYIKATFQANKKLRSNTKASPDDICDTSIVFNLKPQGDDLKDVLSHITLKGDTFYNNDVLIYGYSASRSLGKQNIDVLDLGNTIPGFVNEKTVLYDAQQILHTANYAALDAEDSETEKYQLFLGKIKSMLISLLPDFEKLEDVLITAPKLVNGKLKQGEVLVTTKHGEKIPFDDFSLGYKTMLSWVVDLAWRLFNKYPTSPNPLEECAIVLIDEIDLHLHPSWQLGIVDTLSDHFPNVQFIATAHSPLMVQSALEANFAVLKFEDGSVHVINEPVDVDGWRVDQILTSEFFGMQSARGPEYAKLFRRRTELIGKGKLTASERKELSTITMRMSDFPTTDDPEEIEERKIIKQIISDHKASGKVIKI